MKDFNNPILKTSKLGLIRLSVYLSVFNITERDNQFIYTTKTSTITPEEYELADRADIIKQETNDNIL